MNKSWNPRRFGKRNILAEYITQNNRNTWQNIQPISNEIIILSVNHYFLQRIMTGALQQWQGEVRYHVVWHLTVVCLFNIISYIYKNTDTIQYNNISLENPDCYQPIKIQNSHEGIVGHISVLINVCFCLDCLRRIQSDELMLDSRQV